MSKFTRELYTHAVADKIPISVVISLQKPIKVVQSSWQGLLNVGLSQLSLK